MKSLGEQSAKDIEWSGPRLVCSAGGFTKYDVHAVQQINRNIELIRYLRFGSEFLLLELTNSVQGKPTKVEATPVPIQVTNPRTLKPMSLIS